MKRSNIERSRELRKNQTDAEQRLWALLRNRQLNGAKFRRQFPVGRYIVDFYCPDYRLGIEADGGQHYERKGTIQDDLRTRELNKLGIEIIRFSDREILSNSEGVFEVIQKAIAKKRGKAPSPHPSPRWGEGGSQKGE
jgi:very-short-patch-repair endonuclease